MATNYPNGDNSGIDIFNEPSNPEYASLSSAGIGGNLNHVEHHRNLGDAVVALQTYAARKGHDHSGSSEDPDAGPTLDWNNTHDGVNVADPNGWHHTLGTAHHQAAHGDHGHSYNSLTGITWLTGLTAARPATALDGTVYYATDTNRVWVYNLVNGARRWALLPLGIRPVCRLVQTKNQTLSSAGSPLEWGQALEDSFGQWSSGSPSVISFPEPGLYRVEASMQWSAGIAPDTGTVTVHLNGQPTSIRQTQVLRGNRIQPGFSQTVSVSGHVRADAGNWMSLVVSYTGDSSILSQILSFFDSASRVQSRIDVTYVSP